MSGLWRGDGGPLTYLSDNFNTNIPIAMNNLGEVAFVGHANGLDGVFKTIGGAPITIASTLDFSGINDSASPGTFPPSAIHVNDAGLVVFNALPTLDPQQQTVFVSGGGPVFPAGPSGYGEAINNLGLVAVGTSTGAEILGIPPVGPTTVLANLPLGYDGIGYPEVNNAGDLIAAALHGADVAVIKFENGVPHVLAESWISTYDINDAGGVAFASDTEGVNGIYTGANLATDGVIRVGDPLFGSTLAAFSFGPDGLDDLGRIAFSYQLANGNTGIAIATPVPEPASAATLSIGTIALAIWSMCRQRLRRPSRAAVNQHVASFWHAEKDARG
jgi:hypothetical protein